jgi:hypothetical protein
MLASPFLASRPLNAATGKRKYLGPMVSSTEVASTPRDDASRRSRFAEHFPEVAHECFRLFVCREVPTDLVLRLEHDIPLGT